MFKSDLQHRIIDILAQQAKINIARIHPHTTVAELAFNDQDVLLATFKLCERFKIEMDIRDEYRCFGANRTVAYIANFVNKKIDERDRLTPVQRHAAAGLRNPLHKILQYRGKKVKQGLRIQRQDANPN